MKEIVTATEKVEKRMSLGLQSRLLYLLLKCPLLQQGQGCACKEAQPQTESWQGVSGACMQMMRKLFCR